MPYATDFRMLCEPDQWPETTVSVTLGWSPSINDVCVYAAAFNAREGLRSITVSQGYPPDCVPVPEPASLVMLTVGFIFLLIISMGGIPRRRR